MDLKQLEYFVHVAEFGSFTLSSRFLRVAQPALSRQVRALETDLKEYLFVRNGRGVALTEAGRRLFDHSVAILQLVSHARTDLGASRDKPVGRVTVALPPSCGRLQPLAPGRHSLRLAKKPQPTMRLAAIPSPRQSAPANCRATCRHIRSRPGGAGSKAR